MMFFHKPISVTVGATGIN